MTAKKQTRPSETDADVKRPVAETDVDGREDASRRPGANRGDEEQSNPPADSPGDDLTDPEDLIEDDDGEGESDGERSDILGESVGKRAFKAQIASQWRDRDASTRREDPVKTYLREIGKVPLLTKEGEVELAKAMEIGAYAELSIAVRTGSEAKGRLKKEKKGLTDAEQVELEELVAKGDAAAELLVSSAFDEKLRDELPVDPSLDDLRALVRTGRAARDRLTISNLRLVVSIAKRYMNRGLSFLDLIQEGNMGLMKAVEKFDYTRGYKFSTYATWWIRQAITRAIADQSRTIRVPVHMIETVRELNRVKREYIQSHGSAPTLEDLSELTGMSIDKIKKVESVSQYTASLERPIGEEDEDTLGDFIEDPSSPSPTKETFRMFLREQLSRALDQLDEREREILKLRYGLEDGHPRTLKDVSLKFNITRERVRQIEIKAIEKLKHPSRRAELKRFRELLLAEE